MEIPDYVSIAKKIGFDTIRIAKMWNWGTWSHEEFQKKNVSDKSHPHYKNFLDILKHPDILNDKTIFKNYWTNELNDKT